jgi:hypothetical protein
MTAGNYFEIAFVTETIEDPADDRIDRAVAVIPNLGVSSYGDLTVMTALVRGGSAVEAGIYAAKAIDASGINVLRSYQDLVTRQDIADRLEVTRQAVGTWVRGERHHDTPFPPPSSLVAGGVWLWGDVVAWCRASGRDVDDANFPSLEDHNRLDLLISAGVKTVTLSTYEAASDIAFRQRGKRTQVDAVYQHTYALAS